MAELSLLLDDLDTLIDDLNTIIDITSGLKVNEEWSYAVIDHADTSPVEVSSGVPVVIGGVWCLETMATTPDFALYDGATEVVNLPTNMALGDEKIAFKGTIFATDLDVVIAAAGTAGKIVVQYKTR